MRPEKIVSGSWNVSSVARTMLILSGFWSMQVMESIMRTSFS